MEDTPSCRIRGSSSVSSYVIGSDGTLTLLRFVAGNVGNRLDMALSKGSRYLYVHAAGQQAIAALRVVGDGGLTPIAGAGGLPFGAQGIAAR